MWLRVECRIAWVKCQLLLQMKTRNKSIDLEGNAIPAGYCHTNVLYAGGVNNYLNSNHMKYLAQLCDRFSAFRQKGNTKTSISTRKPALGLHCRRSIVVRTLVSNGKLSLSCARLPAGRVTTCGTSVRYRSANMANSAIHPPGVGKWVVIHVIRYMDYGVKA